VAANPQPVYHLLVHNKNASMWMRKSWNNHIEKLWEDDPIRDQTFWMFHLKTNNLKIRFEKNTKIGPKVSIQSMHFVFPFCPVEVGYSVVPISKKNWEAEATLLSDFSRFLPLRVENLAMFTTLPSLREFFMVEFTLRNLIPRPMSSLLDRGMAEFIFPNATFTLSTYNRTCFCCKLNLPHNSTLGIVERFQRTEAETYDQRPHLLMRQDGILTLINTNWDVYSFLSCGESYNEPPNFKALLLPFTKLTWGLIFVTIFGWPLVLSLIENDFNLKSVLKDFDALFIGWAMILEQSHLRATNYKGRGPLYCYCGCVLLAIFILSNAYKGDNILTLTKSFELVPLTHTSRLLQAGYKTYGVKTCVGLWLPGFIDIMTKYTGDDGCTNDLYDKEHKSRITDEQLKLWKPMGYVFKDNFGFHQGQLDFLNQCQRTALLYWRSVLEPLEKQLLEKHEKAKVNLGQEYLFTHNAGWQLRRYGSIKVLKRMWTLVESGVYNELRNISFKPSVGTFYKRGSISINGNILVQFIFHSFGLLLALLVFFVEFHKGISSFLNPVRVIFSFLIRNFVQQTQKALLRGLKILWREKSYFLGDYGE